MDVFSHIGAVALLAASLPAAAQIVTMPVVGGSFGAAVHAAPLQAPALSLSPTLAAPSLAPSLTASLPSLPAASAPISSASGSQAARTGAVHFLRDFHSDALGNSRRIAVYLPPGYESSSERYPVLYMQDGQNLFDADTERGGQKWGIDTICDRLIASGELPPFIVVAVDNTPDRIPEYTPVSDPGYGGGRGALYGKFLVDELKPFIDANLRTLPGAESTGLMGSSLGGLISLHVGLGRPDVFSRVGALSPSLWWADQELTRRLESLPPAEVRARLWLDMGTREGDNPGQRVAETRILGGVLQARGWREGNDLSVRVIEGAGHNERAWRERAAEVLKFLFAPR